MCVCNHQLQPHDPIEGVCHTHDDGPFSVLSCAACIREAETTNHEGSREAVARLRQKGLIK